MIIIHSLIIHSQSRAKNKSTSHNRERVTTDSDAKSEESEGQIVYNRHRALELL